MEKLIALLSIPAVFVAAFGFLGRRLLLVVQRRSLSILANFLMRLSFFFRRRGRHIRRSVDQFLELAEGVVDVAFLRSGACGRNHELVRIREGFEGVHLKEIYCTRVSSHQNFIKTMPQGFLCERSVQVCKFTIEMMLKRWQQIQATVRHY